MKRCANCDKPAVFNYMSTLYCDSHLPRFLKTRQGLSVQVAHVAQDAPSNVPVWVEPTGEAVETFVETFEEPAEVVEETPEEVTEEVPVVREAPRPTPKKAKYTPKAVTPSE